MRRSWADVSGATSAMQSVDLGVVTMPLTITNRYPYVFKVASDQSLTSRSSRKLKRSGTPTIVLWIYSIYLACASERMGGTPAEAGVPFVLTVDVFDYLIVASLYELDVFD